MLLLYVPVLMRWEGSGGVCRGGAAASWKALLALCGVVWAASAVATLSVPANQQAPIYTEFAGGVVSNGRV